MRIHLVCGDLDVRSAPGRPGWSGRSGQVRDLAAALAAEGHDVTVLCRDDGPGPAAGPGPAGPVVVRPVPAGDGLRERLAGQWLADPPDVVHALDRTAGIAAAAAVVPSGGALVQSLDPVGGPDTADGVVAQDVLLRRAERVLTGSEARAGDLLRRGAPRHRLRVVPPGVDPRVWRPDGGSLRRGGTARVVLVGSLEPGGGADDAVAAMRHVPEAELYVAGGPLPGAGPDADLARLQEVAAGHGAARRVRFLGAVGPDDVGRLLRSADVVACPSRQGVSGASVLEAMACGRAVVATSAGCQRDIVVDGVTGRQVRPGDPAGLGATLRAVLADPCDREAYGIAGRDRVLARYPWSRIAAAVLDVYDEAVRERHPEPLVAG